ncbi:cytochrome P450 [Acidimicrobiia bacterium EGI L10123]|uniref:cytochrome P450 n=1 Tax=Salinilacustrithrix flava TaxID=2957203 RepID=UPI003D7C18D0|nr:cytochrome P450 [Acidimicrobiia bacterium EGI L10123]
MSTIQPPVTIDLRDPEFWRTRQHEAWTWARANDPVHWDEANQLWAITRHADVQHVERHSEVFSSLRTYRLNETPTESNMIANDDPRHLQQRRLVNRGFTPKAVREQSAQFEAMIAAMVDPLTPQGRCEVVDAIAGQLPARFTCNLLGLPEDEWRTVKSWSERLMRIDSVMFDQEAMAGLMAATMEIWGMVEAEVTDLRGCPAHGLISTWANAEIEGEPLSQDTIFNEVGLFIAGGAETTRTAIAHGLRTFCDHNDQWELLHDRPELIPSAVDEVIRWVTPLNNMFRKATEDVELRGRTIKAGDRLALVYPSANRDEDVFEDPFTFDVTRSPNPHVAFGYGTHFCLGANFARRELEILLGTLTREWTNLRVEDEIDVEPNIFAPAVRSFGLAFDAR